MHQNVPHYIRDLLQGEPVDFIVESKRDLQKRRIGIGLLVFVSTFSWIMLFPFLFMIPLIELLLTGKTTITVNGTLETFTHETIAGPLLFAAIPTAISFIFIIPIVFVIYKAISYIRGKGSWYAGTNNHLIKIDGSKTEYYPWNEFEKRIDTKTHGDLMDIVLYYKRKLQEEHVEEYASQAASHAQITLNGKPLDINKLFGSGPFSSNKIGLIGLTNGSYVLNLIRHNMERFE